ncbi:MAG: ABC transporter ATP-binding protein [Christensenellaceae bacterium]|nr:ABC transporter ATP-binding protein [Christensenellaceae bacterium]
MSCLSVTDLNKTFFRKTSAGTETIKALNGVTFKMHEGQSVGIIGTSGCGKTTLLNVILGLVKPDNGDVHKHDPVGIVGQDPYASLRPNMTVEQIIAEPLIFLKKEKSFSACIPRVEEVMNYVHLPRETYGRRFPDQLSGGERQRVGIARALTAHPRLLLLDEPTSMLDQEVKDGIAALLRDIALTQNTAFLMVTHDIEMACRVCDRILVMDKGQIIEDRTAEDLLRDPHTELAKDLLRISTDVSSYWQEKYNIVK